ncbi:MAG: NlpC/P60 family protein, partial [Acidimicrobiales bacterium]
MARRGGRLAVALVTLVALGGFGALSSGGRAGALSIRAGGCGPRAGAPGCAARGHGASSEGQRIASAARSQVGRGLGYVNDGGSPTGPTGGGFDCTGLALYAIYRATGADGFSAHNAAGWVHGWGFSQWVVSRPGVESVAPWGGAGDPYPVNASGRYPSLLPGDILVIAGGAHVGIYLGGGTMVQADSQIGVTGQAWYFPAGVGTYSLWYESGTGTYPITGVYRFTGSASPPPAPTVYRNQVLRVPATGAAYWADAGGTIHWIPDALTYDYYVALDGAPVSLTQAQVNRLGSGQPWAPRQVRPIDAANHILVVSATGTAYLADSTGQVHWIPTTAVYGCLVARGYSVVRGIVQAQVNRLGSGQPWATCTAPPPPPPPTATAAAITISWSSAHPS